MNPFLNITDTTHKSSLTLRLLCFLVTLQSLLALLAGNHVKQMINSLTNWWHCHGFDTGFV